LIGKISQEYKKLDLKELTFRRLQAICPNICADNKQFQLLASSSIKITPSPFRSSPILDEEFQDPIQIESCTIPDSDFMQKRTLQFDSSRPLAESISRHFGIGREEAQYISLCPRFLQIQYHVSIPCSITTLRALTFEAPVAKRSADQHIVMEIQRPTYRLCTVVRSTDGESEEVRTYAPIGKESIPAEVGDYRSKEPDATASEHWSIEQPGDYILFYYREYIPDGWQATETILDAPEWEERPWMIRDKEAGTS